MEMCAFDVHSIKGYLLTYLLYLCCVKKSVDSFVHDDCPD